MEGSPWEWEQLAIVYGLPSREVISSRALEYVPTVSPSLIATIVILMEMDKFLIPVLLEGISFWAVRDLPIFVDSEHLFYPKAHTLKKSRAFWWHICSPIRYTRCRIIFHFTGAQQRPDGPIAQKLHSQQAARLSLLSAINCYLFEKEATSSNGFSQKVDSEEDDKTLWISFLGCHFSPRPLFSSGGYSILLISSIGCTYITIFEMNTYQSLPGWLPPMWCLIINRIHLCSLRQCQHVHPRKKCLVRIFLSLLRTIANRKLSLIQRIKYYSCDKSHLSRKVIDSKLEPYIISPAKEIRDFSNVPVSLSNIDGSEGSLIVTITVIRIAS